MTIQTNNFLLFLYKKKSQKTKISVFKTISQFMNKKPKTKPIILQRARQMRHKPTKAERQLWCRLRRSQLGDYKFRRQQPIGNYIVDFFCHQAQLIVEVDGDVHAFQETEDGERTAWLEEQGYRLIRFNNLNVFENLDGVLQVILEACDNQPSP